MRNPKFIIEGGTMVLGLVGFHRELARNRSLVIGGGWYHYDPKEDSYTFYGSSEEFGAVSQEKIKECVESLPKRSDDSSAPQAYYYSDLSMYEPGDRRVTL